MRSAPLLALGFLLLVIGSYFDTIRGILLPAVTQSLGIDYAKASGFLVAGYIAAITCNLVLQAICRRFTLRRMVEISLLISIASCVLAHFTHSYWMLLVLGFLLGIVLASTGSLCNIAVIDGTHPSHRSRWLCGLHIMYGVGSQFAPLIVAALMVRGWPWQASITLGVIPLVLFLIWVRTIQTPRDAVVNDLEPTGGRLHAGHWLAVTAMSTYGLGEVLVSSWLTAYLTASEGMTIGQAAPWVAGFFAMIALSRAATAFWVPAVMERRAVLCGLAGACFFFVLGRMGFIWAFPLAGILGPFFPLTVSRITHNFPVVGPRVTILGLMGLQLAVGTGHLLMGLMTDHLGIRFAYWLPVIALAVTWVLAHQVFRTPKPHEP